MVNIGVLALQGSVVEHLRILSMVEGVNPVEVRTRDDLKKVSGLIIPGGESTTIGKLIKDFELEYTIVEAVKAGMPVWGTCAGMIILAKEVMGEGYTHLGLMDISVRRNAYGSQLDSFKTTMKIGRISGQEIPLVFIRAPWVEKAGDGVDILGVLDNRIVAVEQGNMLATSFHPELTGSTAFHSYFADKVKQWCGV